MSTGRWRLSRDDYEPELVLAGHGSAVRKLSNWTGRHSGLGLWPFPVLNLVEGGRPSQLRIYPVRLWRPRTSCRDSRRESRPGGRLLR